MIALVCLILEALLVVGLVVRGRARQCYFLFILALAWLASALVVELCPAYLTWEFWNALELSQALLAFLVALELMWRAFRQVPRAWWWSRWLLGATIIQGVILMAAAPPGPVSVHVTPWLLGALACLYMGLWAMTCLLAMPQEWLHSAVLGGLAPYLIVYAVTWGQSTSDTTLANIVNPGMFTITLVLLVRPAWRREPAAPPVDVETLRWLFPWRF